MSKTESKMLPLGTKAAAFALLDTVSGQQIQLESTPNYKATVIMFLCNHCPYVKYINAQLSQLAKTYLKKSVRFLAISSNDVSNYPEDSPEQMRLTAQKEGYPFPYLYDETQEVAKAYQAACTPDFFVFDKNLLLVYRGQFDDSRPGNQAQVSGDSLRQALDSVLNDCPVGIQQKPSLGCNIKWKD